MAELQPQLSGVVNVTTRCSLLYQFEVYISRESTTLESGLLAKLRRVGGGSIERFYVPTPFSTIIARSRSELLDQCMHRNLTHGWLHGGMDWNFTYARVE